MKTQYLSPSEVKELRTICSDLSTPPDDREEWEAEESDNESRNGYALAVAFRHDPESFDLGGPLHGLHPAHAVQVASLNRQPIGWTW